jgi:hypothetical protein
LFRDGLYTRKSGETVQRWRCRECGRKFIEKTIGLTLLDNLQRQIYSPTNIDSSNQLCEQEAKKLEPQIETKTIAGEILQQDTKGKIVEFSFWMLKEGYAKSTIKTRTKILMRLVRLQADIFNPESIKETIAKTQWSSARKCIAIDAYTSFLQMQNLKWEPPIFNRIRKLPFIPTENEIDTLIGGCN